MKRMLLTWDLHRPHRDYPELYEAINRIAPVHVKPESVESIVLLLTPYGVEEVIDALKPYVDDNDSLFIVELTGNWWSHNLNPDLHDIHTLFAKAKQ